MNLYYALYPEHGMLKGLIKGILMLLFSCGLLHVSGTPAHSEEYRAWISIQTEGSDLRIEAFCEAPEDGFVNYELKALKTGRAGEASSSQSGRVYLKRGKTKSLSRLMLGASPKDKYEISLEVYRAGKLVAKDSVHRRKAAKHAFKARLRY